MEDRDTVMNRDKDTVNGFGHKMAGKAKEAFGSLTGDTQTEAEGTTEKMKGEVQEGIGKIKDAARGFQKGVNTPDPAP